MREPIALFAAFSEALARGELPDDEARRWWLAGTRRALARGERLDQGLGLSRQGCWGLQAQVQKLARDAHLIDAAAGITLDPRATNRERAERLAVEIEVFVADDWPATRALPAPPREWAPWRVQLWHAARCDLGLPCDVRHLQRLLANNSAFAAFARQTEVLSHLRSLLLLGTDTLGEDAPDPVWHDRP